MNNCIFSAHCTESFCDESCPAFVETSYLLERNDLNLHNAAFHQSDSCIQSILDMLSKFSGKLHVIQSENTVTTADNITYCAICKNWQGSRLHCNVYNLKYSNYIDWIKKSWSTKQESTELEYIKIWAASAKILIVSNLDYVSFNDFESQTLLNLIQCRSNSNQTTIIVTPKISMLVGKGLFFVRLQKILAEAVNG